MDLVVIGHLHNIYQQFNEGFFDSSLPSVGFTPHYQIKQALRFQPPKTIEIGAGCVDLTRIQLLGDLLHVMVHIHNWERGIVDVTQNQYHRMAFCKAALTVGLFVGRHPTRGWGVTAFNKSALTGSKVRCPPQSALKIRSRVLREITFNMVLLRRFQVEVRRILSNRPIKQFQYRYICKCKPPVIVRVGRKPDGPKPFDAKCLYCDAKFVLPS